ncbi:MAG: glycosyltransferase family 4 protein [Acidobacteria bacterium]|nr:glycosyltransferase family 4 protein [Acidobacteriota bacterium]
MFNGKIGIITPWFGRFAGGAELLARNMARELNKRGVQTIVFTTCSLSPYDSWWEDHYEPGVYDVEGIETHRFATGKIRAPYDSVIKKLTRGRELSIQEQQDFFDYGINSEALVQALRPFLTRQYQLLALPYFHGLTHSVVNPYPNEISLVPCFHDEPQFYWKATERLLENSKLLFFNSREEKELTVRQYGRRVGRRVVEGVVAGVGVELAANDAQVMEKPADVPESYFIYAGRKERGKNVHLLCEWFAEYTRRFRRGTKLVFIGGGDQSLLPRDEHYVDLGFVSDARKLQLIRHSKAIINLSDNESFSIVIMEGWLCGVPCVVSANCAVTRSHVRRSNGGLFVSSSDEFCLALKYLEDQEHSRTELAANGHRYVSREFSFDVVLSKYLDELVTARAEVDSARPSLAAFTSQ